jgi:hypothetical protein
VTGRSGSPLPRWAAASAASRARRAEAPGPGREDVPRVVPAEAPPATKSRHETTPATTVASLAIGSRSVDSHDAARPTSHRWRKRSQLCSWHTQASSYLQRHRPQRLSSTLMNREHTLSSVTAPATTRLMGGASTPAPPITLPVYGSSSLSLTPMSEAPSSLGTPPAWRSRASAPSSSPSSLVSTDYTSSLLHPCVEKLYHQPGTAG